MLRIEYDIDCKEPIWFGEQSVLTSPPDRKIDWENTDVVWPMRTTKGFGRIYQSLYWNIPNGESGWDPRGMSGRSQGAKCTGGIVPYWFAVVTFGFVAAAPWVRWSKRFRLRALLMATTIVAVLLGLFMFSGQTEL
jgi:hypothetical protein